MNWKKFMDEGDYQDFLLRALTVARTGKDRFRKRTNADYCREYAMDKALVIEFLESTQPEKMARLSRLLKARRDERIFAAINSASVGKGGSLIATLKNDLSVGGESLKLFYPPPVSVLEKTVAKNWEKNIFSVAREVWASDAERIDHVIFLNGLAIITVEMKCEVSKQNYTDAIRQYREERNPETRIFRFKSGALVHFALDLSEAWMTTELKGLATHFIPFNKGNGKGIDAGKGNPVVKGHFSTEYMWEEILTRETLSEIVARFVFIEKKERKDPKHPRKKLPPMESVIFPRYHQLDCVRRVLADVYENGTARNYLIMHSAGSGKTNSIAWLAHRLSCLHDAQGEVIINTVIVVTDRVVVDRQLQRAILSLDHQNGEIYVLDEEKTSDDLRTALENGTKIVATTIQKFPYIVDSVKGLGDKRFAVIIDEAHSSTSGKNMMAVTAVAGGTGKRKPKVEGEEEMDAEDVVHQILKGCGKQPNVSMLAFTATPKYQTLKMFGSDGPEGKEPFHVYSMKQAIEEEFIKDVLANYVEYKTFQKIIKTIPNDPRFKQRKAAAKIKRILALHDTNIKQRVQIIVEHFREYVRSGLGYTAKAMIVTSSRQEAVKYRLAIEKYIKDNDYGSEMRALVAFSGKVTMQGETFTEPGMNGFSEASLPDNFDLDENNVLIVANKYQTGFDQKKLSAMYVLKKLSGVNAVQTLSRLNRFLPDKTTFVLDFVNTCQEMVRAFGKYYTTTVLADDVTPQALYDLLREIEIRSIYTQGEVKEYWSFCCKRQTDATRQQIVSILSAAKKRFDNLGEADRKEALGQMRRFVKWYDFIVQAAFLDDALLYEKREFIDRLIGFVDIGSGGGGFSLKDKVDAVDFEQRKVLETHKPDIPSDPTAKVPDPGQTGEEDEEENLSKIIERLNSLYGFKGDAKVLTKSIGQIRAMCEANEKLARTAKVSTLSQYKLPFFQAGQDAMSDCLDQNEAFFTLLLNNEDAMKTVLEAIVRQVYEAQRGRVSEPEVLHEVGEALRYREYLPYYTLSAACGRFGAERLVEEPLGWVRIAGRLTKNENLYVVRASGHSMEPRIKDGDYCVFEYREGAKPEDNAIVLAEHADVIDDETRGAYSIKKFVTQKGKVVLKPLNRGFSDIRIDSSDGYRIVGVFRENYQVETAGSN